ncbi:MAG: hypothetical protein H0T79_18535 [Deltaproteobacteria bacterium]|nr:hypothetical protein [Deltaproteobacteria bacterium]
MANVKGSALSSRILWIQLSHGAAGVDKVLAMCTPELRDSIAGGIKMARWYPFEQFVELNVVIDIVFGQGDLGLIKTLGRYGADANLTTIYRLFFKVGSTQWILGRAVRLWSAHYDSGYLEVTTKGTKGAILKIRGFATPHRVHCMSVLGWCERSVELSGGKRVETTESRCRTRGDDCCQIDASWE